MKIKLVFTNYKTKEANVEFTEILFNNDQTAPTIFYQIKISFTCSDKYNNVKHVIDAIASDSKATVCTDI